MSYEEVVFRRSYLNIMLLNASIPGWKPLNNDDDPEWDGIEKGKTHANEFFGGLM
ncbi:MAG: hypothetical protein LBV72_19790 [Tannerella sp.]|nr:hypothetical protein [Tannerella sp.]